MKIRNLHAASVGFVGIATLLLVTVRRPSWSVGSLEAVEDGVLSLGGTTPLLLLGLLVLLGCAAALFAFRFRGNLVTLDPAIGLATLLLFGPLPAAWMLVAAAGVRILFAKDFGTWRADREHLLELGIRPMMALSAGIAFHMAGGRVPLRGLEALPGWRQPEAAGWAPVLVAAVVFFLSREVLLSPRRFGRDADDEAWKHLLRHEVPLFAANVSLGVILALSFQQPGVVQAILLSGLVLLACRAFQGMVENREDLSRRVEEMRSLNMVGRAICSSMQPEDLMTIVYRECRRLLDTSLFFVALHEEESKLLRMELLAEGDDVLEGRDVPVSRGFAGLVFRTRRPLLFRRRREMMAHPSYQPEGEIGRIQCESFLWVPIATGDRVYGVLSAQHVDPDRYSEETLQAVQAIAYQAAVALENIHLFRRSTTDGLTGLFLRSYFEQKLEEQMFKARRHGFRLSLMVIDLDDFKEINDTLGHAAGDEVLREVGHAIGHAIRTQDVAARYGGDEFVLLLPGISVENCLDVAARIKGTVQALNFPVLARMGASRITVSIGIATVAPGEQSDLQSLFETADQALYEAKRTGKNRVLARSGA